MNSRVVWSPLASLRGGKAADLFARDAPAAAMRWARGLFDAVKTLSTHARRGRIVPELSREDVRELVYGDYRVVYRVSSRRVEVLTVRHGQRRLDPDEADGE